MSIAKNQKGRGGGSTIKSDSEKKMTGMQIKDCIALFDIFQFQIVIILNHKIFFKER